MLAYKTFGIKFKFQTHKVISIVLPDDLSNCLDLALKNFTDIHSSIRIIRTKLRIVLIQKNHKPPNLEKSSVCGWQQTSRIG